MPLHRIYTPKHFFTKEEKRELVESVTSLYVRMGLPPFLVNVLFIQLEDDDFYIGMQAHSERAQEQGKKFVRIVSQHLARTSEGKERRMKTIESLEERFRTVLERKRCEWEIHIEEPPADLWHLSGFRYPAPGTSAEAEWVSANKAVAYEGSSMADHLAQKAAL
ncbi:hypothetical protein EX895_001519 [Sporisorium graminicola]|uniref:Tautomerase cis-CaaD-like domain-containing protein n=1 Tax=Sporisorium graminicola TaxID=280036 RepID=A0A4U7KY09_9BASI|nr:hypothetical protein EX895_001519 [Sporisorium graminicola]TKY89734.1 hypothetical protein EX895_001519 [Sporisorium graminicola]